MRKVTNLEIFKFAFYVFSPIAVLYYVDSPAFQNKHVKPYTLYPSAGKQMEIELFPPSKEEEEAWHDKMKETAPIRKRAKEILESKNN